MTNKSEVLCYYALPSRNKQPCPRSSPTVSAAGDIANPGAAQAPTYDSTSIAYFKMVDAEGFLCFPDNYQLGLETIVMVAGQMGDVEV